MDYGFVHDGTVYTPNGTAGVTVDENTTRNQTMEAAELAQWATQPDQLVAYFHFQKEERYRQAFRPGLTGAFVTTWLGTRLGTIISANVYQHNLGGRFISLRVQGTNGATYHGRASYDWGQCVMLRKRKTR